MKRSHRTRSARSLRPIHSFRRSFYESLEQRLLLTILVVDNATDAAVTGQLSLRQAVSQAELDAAGGTSDTITFDASLGGQTINLTQGDLELTNTGTATITIDGSTPSQPVTISESSADGALVVESGAQAVVSNLIFNDCSASTSNGAAIQNAGTLTVTNTIFSNDQAATSADTITGGAIANTGTLTLNLDTFSNDDASSGTSSGGALATSGAAVVISDCSFANDYASNGGAISSTGSGTLTLNNDSFSNDAGEQSGSAIYSLASTVVAVGSTFSDNLGAQTVENDGGQLTLTDCTFSSNNSAVQNDDGGDATITDSTFDGNDLVTNGSGAAIAVNGGTVNVAGSTFVGNTNDNGNGGGAIGNSGGTVNVVNSTFYQNSAFAAGGAIDNASGTLTLADDTLTQNTAYGSSGGINNAGTLKVQNSIISGNTGATANPDITGSITTDLGNNLLGTAADNSATIPSPGPGDVFNDNPDVSSSPGNYGGPTQTLALLAGSPAIGAGNSSAANLPAVDQRGLPRVVGGSLDIGAFQTQAPTLAFTTLGQTFQVGQSASITLQAEDLDGQPVIAGTGGLTVTLTSNSAGGAFFDSLGNPLSGGTIVIPSGASSVTFEYSDKTAGNPTLSVSASGYAPASQQEDILPAPISATPSTDIIVGRVLSAYYTGDVQNNQVTITLTVYNQSSNSITGVLLTDTLESGVTLVSASQQPDQSGQNLAWSLGTIEGDDWASVTITVSLANSSILQLDTGAQAYATLNALAISNVTPVATLTQGSVDDNLLASTPDANTADPYIQEEAAALDYNPQNIFNFLQDDISYNAYQGSLRGARGTLWSGAGNSLDVASLGVALMRASGIPAQYEEGTLSYDQAQQLILSMFPNSYQTVGYVPAGTTVADPADDPTLQAETQDHFWFQFEAGDVMVSADPLMAGAVIGQAFTTITNQFAAVPQSMEQTTEIQLTAEIYSQAAAAFSLGGNGLTDTVVLDQTFDDVSLVGVPLTIGNFVNTVVPPSLAVSSTTNTYTPYIDLSDEALPDDQQPDAILGTPYQEVITNFPLASQILTGLFLNVTLSGAGTTSETYTDTIVDRIGYAARQGLAPPGNLSVDPSAPPILNAFDLTTLNILPAFQSPAAAQLETERADQETASLTADPNQSQTVQAEALVAIARSDLANLAVASDQQTENLASAYSVAAYFSVPRVTVFDSQLTTTNSQSNLSFNFNLIHDSITAIAAPGQNAQAPQSFAALRGIFDSLLEAASFPVSPQAANLSSVYVIQQAVLQGIPMVTIESSDSALLQTLDLPADAIARITTDIQNGMQVIVPSKAPTIDGTQIAAWWVIDPTTGEILSEAQDGGYQGTALFAASVGTSVIIGAALNVAISAVYPGITNFKDVAKSAVVGAVGGIFPFSALGLIGAVALVYDFLPFGPLGKIDPTLPTLLVGLNIPYPTTPSETASVESEETSNQAAGQISGTVQASNATVSGNLTASWQSAAANFLASSLDAADATVVDSQGATVGTGTASLSTQLLTVLSISGSADYNLSGQGSLSFYGPAESSLGVSGNWDSYSADISGNVSVTLTVPAGTLTLNGQTLPAGTYTITTTAATLGGNGQTTSPDFSGSVAITASNGTINLGPATGSISSGGNPLSLTNGATLDGYEGTINVSANGDGTDGVALSGSSTSVLTVSASPSALTTDDNTPVTFATNINTSLADTYTLTAQGPAGWTVTIDNSGNVTVTPAPGVQAGTFPIQITAQSSTDTNLVANAFVNITITPTLPGMTLALNPYPIFTVSYNGAEVPTAYEAVIHNTGPTADTYDLTFPTIPTGFTVLDSGTSVTIPAGATGIVGIYLQPGTMLPPPGTAESFSVTATSVASPTITQTATVNFAMPSIAAVTVTDDPTTISVAPGGSATTTLTITNVGNVAFDNAISPTLPAGWTISGTDPPVSLAVGASTTETVTITPSAGAPLDSTQNVTLNYGPAVTQNTVAVVGVTPSPATVEAGTSVDVQASILAGMTSDEQGSAGYTVTNSLGTVVFTSTPAAINLPEVTGVNTVDLGSIGTTGLAPGQYTINVTVYDSSGNAIAGATGQGTLLIGAPIAATQSLTTVDAAPAASDTLTPGGGTIGNMLNIAAQAQLSQTATDSSAASVVVSGHYAYMVGASDITIVDITNPTSPTVVGTFGSGTLNTGSTNLGVLAGDDLVVASGNTNGTFSFLVYSLANPAAPTLLGNTTVDYEFPGSMFVQGTTAYVTTSGFGFTGAGPSTVNNQFGDFLAIDFSNPASPALLGALSNVLGSPEGGSTNIDGAAAVTSQLAYVVGSTSTGADTQSGSGQLQVVNIANPTNPSVTTTLTIPNSVQAIGVAIQGSTALVVGTTGGWESPADNPAEFQLSGNITLTLLDISNPASPTILSSMIVNNVTASLMSQGTLNIIALGGNQFAVSDVQSNGSPVVLVVDASNPNNLGTSEFTSVGAVSGIVVSGGVLYASTAAGLGAYQAGSITSLPVTVTVQVPTNTGLSIVAGSFNVAPSQDTSSGGIETLVWNFSSLASIPAGGITWQTDVADLAAAQNLPVTLGTTIEYTALGTTTTVTLPPLNLAGVPEIQALSIPVTVAVPGTTALGNAAAAATQAGNTNLANQLNDLVIALTNLEANPSSAVYLSQAQASLASLVTLTQTDPFLASFAPALTTAGAALAAATNASQIDAAVSTLGTALDGLGQAIQDEIAHGFTIGLQNSLMQAQPGASDVFNITLTNTGTQTTTYDFSIPGLPANVTAVFSQSSITLAPGESIPNGPNTVTVSLSESGTSLSDFDFTVTATAEGATEITGGTGGQVTLRPESLLVGSVTPSVPFTTAGNSVDVSTAIQSVVNVPRSVSVSYVVTDANGNVLFTSTPVTTTLGITSALTTLDLGSVNTTGFANGNDTITVTVVDNSAQPLPSASGQASLTIGLPVSAALSVSPTTLPEGTNETVTNTLQVSAANVSLPNPLTLDGNVQTDGTAGSVAIDGTTAYVVGSEDISVVDISNPASPQVLSTFGNGSIVNNGISICTIVGTELVVATTLTLDANEFTLLIYSLTNPTSPQLLSSTAIPYEFAYGLFGTASTVYVPTNGTLSNGGGIFDQFGSFLAIDISNPASPQLVDELYNENGEPDGGDTEQYGGALVNNQTAYVASSTSTGGNVQSGEGQVLVVNVANPASMSVDTALAIPGTVDVLGVAIEGDQALVVGSTGGWSGPGGNISGNITLTVLNITNPLDPQIEGTTLTTTANIGGIVDVKAIGTDEFVVSGGESSGSPSLLLVDTSDPSNIVASQSDTPTLSNRMAVDGSLLYVTSSQGLTSYEIGALASVPYTVSVEVPNTTGVSITQGSFNTPPTQVIDGATYDTLDWQGTLAYGDAQAEFTWQSTLSSISAAQVLPVTLGATVDFTSQSVPGTLNVPGASVTGVAIASLIPASTTAQPGATVTYDVRLFNPTNSSVSYYVIPNGAGDDFSFHLNSEVTVGPNGSVDVPLQVTSTAADQGTSPFQLEVESVSGSFATMLVGNLDSVGSPLPTAQPNSYGVAASLSPTLATVGEGDIAQYLVQVTNTGSTQEEYNLQVNGLPNSVSYSFSQSALNVPAGAVDFVDDELQLDVAPGTTPNTYPFSVVISATDGTSSTTLSGTLTVSNLGVQVSISPSTGSPSSVFELYVDNTGTVDDTYNLSLAGPASIAATLGQSSVFVAANSFVEIPITVGAIDFADAGGLELAAIAVSQTNTDVQAATSAEVTIPSTTGLSTSLTPPSATLTLPGSQTFVLDVNNLGNNKDSYTATITGTTGGISASLIGLDGNATQSIPLFLLPGLGTGVLQLNTLMTGAGTGTVTVTITDAFGLVSSSTATVIVGPNSQSSTVLTVTDHGGTYTGSPFPATDTVNNGSSLENVTPTLTYYSGTATTGSSLTSVPSTAGVYTVLASFAGSTDYASAEASTTFTIRQAQPTVSVSDHGGVFNGSTFPAQDLVTGVSGDSAGSLENVAPTLEYYSGASTTGTSSAGAPSTAGTYTVLASFAGTTDYASAAASATFTISQAAPSLIVTDLGGVYTGSPYPAHDSINGVGSLETISPTLVYYSGTAVTGTAQSIAPSTAGTYTVLASFAGSTDYATATASTTFTITKAVPTVLVTDAGGVFSGSPFPATASVNGLGSLEEVSPTLTYYSGTTATGSGSSAAPTASGTYTVLASFAGSTDYTSATARTTFTITGKMAPTLTVTDASGVFSGLPFAANDMVNGGGSLEGVSPTVTYYSGTKASGTPLKAVPSTVGTYTVSASFAGSADYTSAAASATFSITKATPKLTVTDSSGTSTGHAFTASDTIQGVNQVPASSLEGVLPTLTYYSGTSASGKALSSAPSAVGTYTVLASFAGSTDYTSASASVTFAINKAMTPTLKVTDGGGGYTGSAYPATVLVNSAGSLEGVTPTLTYYSGTKASGTALKSVPSTVGTYTASASFAGSVDYTSAVASATFSITKATPQLTVTDNSGVSTGHAFTASDTIKGINQVLGSSLEGVTPTLKYYSGTKASGNALGSAPSAVGTYTVLASFAGSTDYTSASASTTFIISPAPKSAPTLKVTDNGGPYTGSTYPATVQVNGASSLEDVTPKLTYYSGTNVNGASLGGAPSAVGTYAVVASFAGSTDYTSAIASTTFSISQASTCVTISAKPNPVVFGQSVTLTAVMSELNGVKGTPTGDVVFLDGSTNLGSATLAVVGGIDEATLSTKLLPAGVDYVTASYQGGGNFAPSVSSPYDLTVSQCGTATKLTITPCNTSQTVTLTATTTSGNGAPNGSVTFDDGNSTLGTVSSTNGTFTLTTTLSAGKHSLTAEYVGNASYSESVSTTLVETVSATNIAPAVVDAVPWQNSANPLDVIGLGGPIVPLDALDVINYLNANPPGAALPAAHAEGMPYYDVLGTNSVIPQDALEIIDYLNSNPVSPAATQTAAVSPAAVSPAVTGIPTAGTNSPTPLTVASSDEPMADNVAITPAASQSDSLPMAAAGQIVTPAVMALSGNNGPTHSASATNGNSGSVLSATTADDNALSIANDTTLPTEAISNESAPQDQTDLNTHVLHALFADTTNPWWLD